VGLAAVVGVIQSVFWWQRLLPFTTGSFLETQFQGLACQSAVIHGGPHCALSRRPLSVFCRSPAVPDGMVSSQCNHKNCDSQQQLIDA
jgi:hypothetical protein